MKITLDVTQTRNAVEAYENALEAIKAEDHVPNLQARLAEVTKLGMKVKEAFALDTKLPSQFLDVKAIQDFINFE